MFKDSFTIAFGVALGIGAARTVKEILSAVTAKVIIKASEEE